MVFIENDRIIGWNCPPKEILVKLRKLTIQNQVDKYNRPNWRWPDYPEGEPLYSPQAYNLEQTEQLRKAEVRAEIRELYSVEDEMKIHRQNINALMETDGTQTDEYIKYNNTVEKILLNSQKKDFQIGEKNVSK